MYSHRRDIVEILLFYFYFGQQRFSEIPFIRNNGERRNVSLQRRAIPSNLRFTFINLHAQPSPPQALVSLRSRRRTLLLYDVFKPKVSRLENDLSLGRLPDHLPDIGYHKLGSIIVRLWHIKPVNRITVVALIIALLLIGANIDFQIALTGS